MRLKKWTPVEVIWTDAHGGDAGWEVEGSPHKPRLIRSVGMLVRNNRAGVTLVLSRDKASDTVGAYVFIPAANVVGEIRELS
jgi:hypothetical protein